MKCPGLKTKQILVADYMRKYIKTCDYDKFMEKLRIWDHTVTSDCFYNTGVLHSINNDLNNI